MALLIAHRVADGQIGLVAVAAFTQGLNMFKRGIHHVYMLGAYPARHLAVQLAGNDVVDFLAGVGWLAHVECSGSAFGSERCARVFRFVSPGLCPPP